MRRAGTVALLGVLLLAACAPPLRCLREEDDVVCEVSGSRRRRPLAHAACRALGGSVRSLWNERGQEIGDPHCAAELRMPRSALRGSLVVLVALLAALRLRRRRR